MNDLERTDYLDQFTTLDDAKKEIARLVAVEEKTLSFLRKFCNHEIRNPFVIMMGYVSILQKVDLTDQQRLHFLDVLGIGTEKTQKNINIFYNLMPMLQGAEKYTQYLYMHYPSEAIDVNLLLSERISQVKSKTEVKINLAKNLPLAQCNNQLLQSVLRDALWFISNDSHIKIEIATMFDEESISVILACSTKSPDWYIEALGQFKEFENESNFFEFDANMLLLYQSWFGLQLYDGKLYFEVYNNTATNEPATVELTISLKR